MGQRSNENAGIHILATKKISEKSFPDTIIKGCSIHNCNGICVNAFEAERVTLDNNVFYKGKRFHIQTKNVRQWTITNNLFIGVIERDVADIDETMIWDPVAFIYMYQPYSPFQHDLHIYNNVAQGSKGLGFVFPGTPCAEKHDNRFKDNEVGHCAYGGIFFDLADNQCYQVGYQAVYNTIHGIVINNAQMSQGYHAEQLRVAECQTNVVLHAASKSLTFTSFVRKIWVSAVARPLCRECYTEQRKEKEEGICDSGTGFFLQVTTEEGQQFPIDFNPLGYGGVSSVPSAFSSVMMEGIEMHNYRDSYQGGYLEKCGGNRGLRNHPGAASVTASHYLRDVRCRDCEKEGLVYLMEPLQEWRGLYGGCGNFDCTGLENVLIQDLAGDFLGHIGSIVSNNEDITMNSEYFSGKCTYYEKWNAYDCTTQEFGVLEWDAVGSDKKKLHPVPVYISNDYFSNKINMWKEWQYAGTDPMNKRLNRFVSLVAINQVHNITYSGTKSSDMVHKLAQRSPTGEIDRYIVVKYHYDSPLALEVQVGNQIVKPWPLNDQKDLVENNKTDCGANNYYYQNNTIHFVITNEAYCYVRVYQKNYLHINLRIKMTPEQFYNEPERVGRFQDLLAEFLGVDFSQIRIVGLRSYTRLLNEEQEQGGESELQFIVLGDQPGSVEDGYDAGDNFKRLRDTSSRIEQGLSSKSLDLGYETQFSSSEIKVIKDLGMRTEDSSFMTENDLVEKPDDPVGNPDGKLIDEEEDDDGDESMKIIAFGILFGGVVGVLIFVGVYCYWKKGKYKGVHNVHQEENHSPDVKCMQLNRIEVHSTPHSHSDLSPSIGFKGKLQ